MIKLSPTLVSTLIMLIEGNIDIVKHMQALFN
jgi:hypothetical protein